jgi:hypothetical protein
MRTTLLIKRIAAVTLVLLAVGLFGSLTVSRLRSNAKFIVLDNLLGLSYAGAANSSLAQAYNSTLLYLISEPGEQREKYHEAIEEQTRKTAENLDAYFKTAFSDEDRQLYQAWVLRRAEYLAIRGRTLRLAESGDQKAALDHFKRRLEPAYEAFRKAGEAVLDYNVQQGKAHGEKIITNSVITQIAVALAGVFFFVLGFVLGYMR